MLSRRFDRLAIDRNGVVVRIDDEACRRSLSIDSNYASCDQVVSGASARNAGARQEAVQPLARSLASASTRGAGR